MDWLQSRKDKWEMENRFWLLVRDKVCLGNDNFFVYFNDRVI